MRLINQVLECQNILLKSFSNKVILASSVRNLVAYLLGWGHYRTQLLVDCLTAGETV